MAIPIAAALLGGQLLGGAFQLFGAGRRRRAARDAQERLQSNLRGLDVEAREGLPEAEYQQALENIEQNEAAGINYLRGIGGGQALRGISNLTRASNEAGLNLDVQDAIARQRNRLFAFQQRQQFEESQFRQESGAAEALTGAGIQNIAGALTSAATLDTLSDGGTLSNLFKRRRTPLSLINPRGLTRGISQIPTNVSVQPTF